MVKVMADKIKLNKEGVVVFMGTMNAMPMMYALELKKLGYDVLYFVDVAAEDTLSRPENHYPGIHYPYPDWIVEQILPTQIFLPIFPKVFAALYQYKIKKLTQKKVSCFVLGSFFTALSPYLPAVKVGLPHGSDLDVWADKEGADALAKSFRRSIFKFLPQTISCKLIRYMVDQQYAGYLNADVAMYFPLGLNAVGDKVINQLVAAGVKYVPRFDISFEPLLKESRAFKPPSDTLVLFSGVRFLFKTFPDGNTGYNKGNDLIIEGVARYAAVNPNIRVHFVEKGEDVAQAKALCQALGLDKFVIWHKEMPFQALLKLYQEADICFDQVGAHWIGAIGAYALWLHKPLIANVDSIVKSGIFPQNNPVCAARTADEIYEWLVKLGDADFRKRVSDSAVMFTETYLGPFKAMEQIFEL